MNGRGCPNRSVVPCRGDKRIVRQPPDQRARKLWAGVGAAQADDDDQFCDTAARGEVSQYTEPQEQVPSQRLCSPPGGIFLTPPGATRCPYFVIKGLLVSMSAMQLSKESMATRQQRSHRLE